MVGMETCLLIIVDEALSLSGIEVGEFRVSELKYYAGAVLQRRSGFPASHLPSGFVSNAPHD